MTIVAGQTATLTVQWRQFPPDGPLVDVNTIMITITDLSTGMVVLGPTAIGITHPATGTYLYHWVTTPLTAVGDYLIGWSGTDPGTGGPVSTSEIVSVVSAAAAGAPLGQCGPWEPIWCCNLTGITPAVTGTAVQIASEVLWAASAQRFGLCQVTLRPCRQECTGALMWSPFGGWDTAGPWPMLLGGDWINVACGVCGDGCSCSAVSQVMLPGPVHDIVQVLVDGVPLPTSAYRLDDGRLLVRTDGALWPLCNDLGKDDTQPGTWSVTARFGEPVPVSGQAALGQLACEIVKALSCDDGCVLPANVQSLVRQGVSINLGDQGLADIRSRLYLVGLFLNAVNPHGLTGRAHAYDIDGAGFRRAGTG